MGDAKHTETPWRIELVESYGQGDWGGWTIVGDHGTICLIAAAGQRGPIDLDSNRANAQLIVTAVNERSALLKCEEALKIARQEMVRTGFTDFGVKFIDDALSLLDEARNGKA